MLRCLVLVGLASLLCLTACESESEPPAIELLEAEGESAAQHRARFEADVAAHRAERRAAREAADLRVLFVGNSHTSMHSPIVMLQEFFVAGVPERDVYLEARAVGGAFLTFHADNELTLEMIADGPWDFVVLQAQKYSTSGRNSYPFDGAVTLNEHIRAAGAQPLLFPEWGLAGRPGDAQYVHGVYERLGELIDAEVIPVGLTWDRVLDAQPHIVLHDRDGNHASSDGAYLTACVFYAWFSERSPEGLPNVNGSEIPETDRRAMQRIAWETVRAHRARMEETPAAPAE